MQIFLILIMIPIHLKLAIPALHHLLIPIRLQPLPQSLQPVTHTVLYCFRRRRLLGHLHREIFEPMVHSANLHLTGVIVFKYNPDKLTLMTQSVYGELNR